jgi:adenylate cyclase
LIAYIFSRVTSIQYLLSFANREIEHVTERKLTAILAADVVGYSRMMGEDEEGTLATLAAYREAMDALVELYRGRVVGSAGDSLLADFTSVVDAVQCAVEIQRELEQRNSDLPDEKKMVFRIGINLGDVMVRDQDIFGDGVNIAARLESLAAPGGICVSGGVYEQLKNKLAINFQDLGKQNVKNISDPVQAYMIGGDNTPLNETPLGESASDRWIKKNKFSAIAIASITGLFLVTAVVYFLTFPNQTTSTDTVVADRQTASLVPAASETEASLAVLPFVNMGGEADQEIFVDGITESLITDLSNLEYMHVAARTSSFGYKGKNIPIPQIGRELGVRYILEGSVQKSGDSVRINAQLIDAASGRHLWAERFDRKLTDVFAVQDEITNKVLVAIAAFATSGETSEKAFVGKGRIVSIVEDGKRVVLDHEAVENFMGAMTMAYDVSSPELLDGIEPGSVVEFTMNASDKTITGITIAH